jgi:hypothetical protein
MAIEKLKLTTRLKIKSWATPQLKNHTNSHELKIDRTQTRQRNPENNNLNP